MGSGAVGEPNPFQGALWGAAKAMTARQPQGLTDQQLLKLVDKATADGKVEPAEQRLLMAIADPANVQQIARAIKTQSSKAAFEVQGLDFDTVRSRQIAQNLTVGVAGQQIGATYDKTAESRQAGIQAQARTIIAGPGKSLSMATPAGRDAILDGYGQLMGSGVYGPQACGAASLVALAVNAGPQGLGALAGIVRNDRAAYDPDFAVLCDRLGQADATFTLADLATLQDALLERMQGEATNRQVAAGIMDGEPEEGLAPATLQGFISTHAGALTPLFAGGASILPIDNTGDGTLDHFVAYVPRGGQDRIFEPYQTTSGHHLITDETAMKRYVQAMIR